MLGLILVGIVSLFLLGPYLFAMLGLGQEKWPKPIEDVVGVDFYEPMVIHLWNPLHTDAWKESQASHVSMTIQDVRNFERVWTEGRPEYFSKFCPAIYKQQLLSHHLATVWSKAYEFPNDVVTCYIRDGPKCLDWAIRVQTWLVAHSSTMHLPCHPTLLPALNKWSTESVSPGASSNQIALSRVSVLANFFGRLLVTEPAQAFR